ncbi:MAG: hypothetical protein RL447_1235, partial [Bacteroidota bacterium]
LRIGLWANDEKEDRPGQKREYFLHGSDFIQ